VKEHVYYVYIMASRSRTLYIGFTSVLEVQVRQHKDDVYDGFSKQYQCHRLVYFERFTDVQRAIAREKQLKHWSRVKKLVLIERDNPAWYDLSEEWGKPIGPWQEPAGLSTALRFGRDDNSEVGRETAGLSTAPSASSGFGRDDNSEVGLHSEHHDSVANTIERSHNSLS